MLGKHGLNSNQIVREVVAVYGQNRLRNFV
jgi:hypothetical protein